PRAIIRDIQRALLSSASAARLESLVRTEMMRGFRNGLNEQYASMSHLISGYRWSAAKSVRTCLACLARDSMVQKEPWDQMHVNCRCINSPVVKNVTIPYQTGEEWFARQSPARQQRMMPSRQSWEAYRDRLLDLQDFVGTRDDSTWGSSVYQKSGSEALEDAA
ncbi:MAG: phage head morphogenesis protein, partial [Chloroflexota bacterium]|nr:phage head morphogenesis protein [Chloroflexota bacterium]